jgi:hypothetical protein
MTESNNNRVGGEPRTVRELLAGRRYTLDYYQRGYAWERKEIAELLEDLSGKFLSNYAEDHQRQAVEGYRQYFLGSVIISQRDAKRFIVDGQQRLTSLTLLLLHLHQLAQAQGETAGVAQVTELIFSLKYGEASFNLQVEERLPAMRALLEGREFNTAGASASVKAIVARYEDIQELFPQELTGRALPFFVDWLLENVALIEITAYNDDDAYTIFESMNDRGRPLTPTEMLKGYLLTNITGEDAKAAADRKWREVTAHLADGGGKDLTADFIKVWLRAKYANSIRDRKKDAAPRDWDQIGTSFHKWLRDHADAVGLTDASSFKDFIHTALPTFVRHYRTLLGAAEHPVPGLEAVHYNAHIDFTLQYPLMMAPVEVDDSDEKALQKMGLVADFVDIYTARRIVNYKQTGYSAMSYTMFNLIREIRDLDVAALAHVLRKRLDEQEQTLDGIANYGLHQMNRPQIRYILARLTAYAEQACGVPSRFIDYVSGSLKKPFEIEHIWADDYSRFTDQFTSPQEFAGYRNRLGGLVLLPRGFNQSLGADDYPTKTVAYFGQNLLAKTLTEPCYRNNPSFLAFREQTKLPFRPYAVFDKQALDERQDLYRGLAALLWSADRIHAG